MHGVLTWRPTKIMHIQDLPKDDDFLSHLLIEKLGTGTVPLLVHRMDPSRRLPKTHTADLMKIVRRYVASKLPMEKAIKQAVDDLLTLPAIRYFLKTYTQKQINAFATHASRYFELYHPSGSIEIAHTSRYSHRTNKSELCILATRNIPAHTVITELKGSMANLTEEEDQELKRTDERNCDIRRDFSVIHSKSMKKNHLFLGPARFVNHDCNNNCELFREGRYITFRTLRPIAVGEELTAHYGDGYFGKKNKHCLCETCELNGRGGYAPHRDEDSSDDGSSDNSDSDSDASSTSSSSESDTEKVVLNLNERRTRRGVYAVSKPASDSSDESDEGEDDDTKPLADAADIPADGEIELTAVGSNGTPPIHSSNGMTSTDRHSSTPLSILGPSLTEPTSSSIGPSSTTSDHSTPFRSIISTRSQKAKETTNASSTSTPLKESSRSGSVGTPSRLTRSVSLLQLSERAKAKAKASPAPSLGSSKQSRASGKGERMGKNEDGDPRPARTRSDAVKETPKTAEVPRGPDGKPLPTCMTCSNVLPLISMDFKVVWGLETGKRDKNTKRDCPRCLRHIAIYEVSWPRRISPSGPSATPREGSAPADVNTKNVTKENLAVIDRQIAAASTATSKKSKKRLSEPEIERNVKKQKVDHSETKVVLHKPKVIITYGRADKRGPMSSTPQKPPRRTRSGNVTQEQERVLLDLRGFNKRGPTTSGPQSPPQKTYSENVRQEQAKVILDLRGQPRSNNGRFAKKSKISSIPPVQNKNVSFPASSQKRKNEEMEDFQESPRKKSAYADKDDEVVPTIQKVIARRASGFHGGRLFSKPNPQQFALKAWSKIMVPEDSSVSSEDEGDLATPEDNFPSRANIVDPGEAEMINRFSTRASLSCINPSPLAFAKNRWNSFGQTIATPKSRLSLDELYVSEAEPTLEAVGHSPPPSNDDPSDNESLPSHYRQTYPVLSPSAVHMPCIPTGTRFFSTSTETKTTLVNAGWDDASDATEP